MMTHHSLMSLKIKRDFWGIQTLVYIIRVHQLKYLPYLHKYKQIFTIFLQKVACKTFEGDTQINCEFEVFTICNLSDWTRLKFLTLVYNL